MCNMLLTFLIQLYSIKVERTITFCFSRVYYKERLIIITQIILSELFLCQTGVIQLYSIKLERTLLFVLVECFSIRVPTYIKGKTPYFFNFYTAYTCSK